MRIGVAGLDVHRSAAAVVLDLAGAHGHDLGLLGLFLGGVRDDDAATHLLFRGVDAFDYYPVMKRTNVHFLIPPRGSIVEEKSC